MVSAVTAGNGHFDDGFERTPKKMQSARKALEGGSPVRCLSDSVEAMRFVLDQLDYPGKRFDIIGTPDPLIVGPPEVVAAETGETTTRP